MEKSLTQAYDEYTNLLYELLLTNCPVDTGNMITHIRMDKGPTETTITIDTIPYSKAGKGVMRKMRKKQHRKNPIETEYAVFTEYPWLSPRWGGRQNPNESWIRLHSIYAGAQVVANEVECKIKL